MIVCVYIYIYIYIYRFMGCNEMLHAQHQQSLDQCLAYLFLYMHSLQHFIVHATCSISLQPMNIYIHVYRFYLNK